MDQKVNFSLEFRLARSVVRLIRQPPRGGVKLHRTGGEREMRGQHLEYGGEDKLEVLLGQGQARLGLRALNQGQLHAERRCVRERDFDLCHSAS
jgi:hypothetical protein